MLTILHPELLPTVLDHPIGLRPLTIDGQERRVLVLKAPKEMLLTAQLNKGFRIYAVPVDLDEMTTTGLMSAFFDDDDEPLVIYTPLFDHPECSLLIDSLLGLKLDVHLFDEQGRELLGYSAQVQMPTTARSRLAEVRFPSADWAAATTIMDEMSAWFGLRTAVDDTDAITVNFIEPLFPEDLFIQDARPANHAFHGSRGFSQTSLVRQEPGSFQEHDIVRLLQRIFPAEQIYLGPLHPADKKEIADIIVITDSRILLIQAKDSPNIERVLRNPLARKRANAIKNLTKAIKQVRGAIRYVRSASPARMLVNRNEVAISMDKLELTSLIILKEMFNDQYREYSPPLLQLTEETQVPCIALDYMELISYAAHLPDEEAFFAAYNRVFSVGRARGEFPRLRIGPCNSGTSPEGRCSI